MPTKLPQINKCNNNKAFGTLPLYIILSFDPFYCIINSTKPVFSIYYLRNTSNTRINDPCPSHKELTASVHVYALMCVESRKGWHW